MIFIVERIIDCYIFVVASCIGSFLNVVIYRLPSQISMGKGRSYCPNCHTPIKSRDLIPVMSYLWLKGKCRTCKVKISPRYPIIEIFTGAIGVFLFYTLGFTWSMLFTFIMSSILIAIAMIDYDHMIIPDQLVIALLGLAIVGLFLYPEISILSRVIGFFIVSAPMYLLCMVIPDAFGGGDIKLIAVAGLVLGWANTLLAIFIALLIGGSYGAYLMVSKKAKAGAHISFGQYICIGIWVAHLYGETIIDGYMKLFGL